MRAVRLALARPGATLGLALMLLIVVQVAYGKFGRGVEFFPSVEPDYAQVIVHGRGNISLEEKNKAIAEVEKFVLGNKGLKTVYTRIGEQPRGSSEITEDTIGIIQFEFADWKVRPSAHEIMDAIREDTVNIPGILAEVTVRAPVRRPASLSRFRSARSTRRCCLVAAKKVADNAGEAPDIRDLDDGLPLPGIDWRIEVDKAEAAKYAVSSPLSARGAACHQRREGHRISSGREPTRRSISWCASRRSAEPRRDRRVCGCRHNRGQCADRQFRAARSRAARRLYQSRRRQSRDDGVLERRRRRAERQGAEAIAAELAKTDLGQGVTFRLKGEDEERRKGRRIS